MRRLLPLTLFTALTACQSMPPSSGDAISPGTQLVISEPRTIAVTNHGAALQGGQVVKARDQLVWEPLCRLQFPHRADGPLELPPGHLEVANVRTHWRFNEISVNVYAARVDLAEPHAGITGLECEIWAGPQWKDGEFGLTELLSQALLVLMIAEIISSVAALFEKRVLDAAPLLVIGIIASIRRLLVISAEAANFLAEGLEIPTSMLIELGILTVAVGIFAWSIRQVEISRRGR